MDTLDVIASKEGNESFLYEELKYLIIFPDPVQVTEKQHRNAAGGLCCNPASNVGNHTTDL